MKGKLYLLLGLIATPALSAAALENCPPPDPWFTYRYAKLGGGVTSVDKNVDNLGAAIGGGVRIVTGHSGIDLSVDYIDGTLDSRNSHVLLGKGLFLFTFTPAWKQGFYVGLGMGYGRSKLDQRNFVGIFGEGVLGYALITHRRVLAFVEFGIHQPAIATGNRKEAHFEPAASLSFGVGF